MNGEENLIGVLHHFDALAMFALSFTTPTPLARYKCAQTGILSSSYKVSMRINSGSYYVIESLTSL